MGLASLTQRDQQRVGCVLAPLETLCVVLDSARFGFLGGTVTVLEDLKSKGCTLSKSTGGPGNGEGFWEQAPRATVRCLAV